MTAETLELLLRRSHAALLAADFDQLQVLADQITANLADFERLDLQELGRLRILAEENAGMLLAAREGVASVRGMLQGTAPQEFSTYDQTGRRNPIHGPDSIIPVRI